MGEKYFNLWFQAEIYIQYMQLPVIAYQPFFVTEAHNYRSVGLSCRFHSHTRKNMNEARVNKTIGCDCEDQSDVTVNGALSKLWNYYCIKIITILLTFKFDKMDNKVI